MSTFPSESKKLAKKKKSVSIVNPTPSLHRALYDSLIKVSSRRQYIYLVLGPSTDMWALFLEYCTPTYKGWRLHVGLCPKHSQRRQGPILQPFDLSSLLQVSLDIFLYNDSNHQNFCDKFLRPLRNRWLFVLGLYVEVCPFNWTTVVGSGNIWPLNLRLTTPIGWLLSLELTVLSPQSVCSRTYL